jgi:hypothetical protein
MKLLLRGHYACVMRFFEHMMEYEYIFVVVLRLASWQVKYKFLNFIFDLKTSLV